MTCTVRFSNLSYELNPEYIKGTINVKIDKEVYSIGLNADVLKRIDGMFWVNTTTFNVALQTNLFLFQTYR